MLLEDDALFQCQVGAADGVAPIRSRNAQLTVYVPPEDPFIVQVKHFQHQKNNSSINLSKLYSSVQY